MNPVKVRRGTVSDMLLRVSDPGQCLLARYHRNSPCPHRGLLCADSNTIYRDLKVPPEDCPLRKSNIVIQLNRTPDVDDD